MTRFSLRSAGRAVDSARVWSQSIARQSLTGGGKTHNPTPAAVAIIKQKFGAKRTRRAIARAGKLRRRFHRGNPAPAVLLSVASKLPGLGGLFKTASEKRAAKVAGALVASAVSGNLTAAKAINERQEIGIAKERSVWRSAWNQVPNKIRQQLKQYADIVPGVDHTSPESAAESALTRAVDVNELIEAAEEKQRELREVRAAGARETAAARERRETKPKMGRAGWWETTKKRDRRERNTT